jgi:hypothetical protein
MWNNSRTSEKVKEQIMKFAGQITRGFTKPRKKFVSQIIYGIQAARDLKLSNISRSLNEEIKLIKTETRLSRHISREDFTEHVNEKLLKNGQKFIGRDTVLALDLSDINKPFAEKMEYLALVWDGSEKKVDKGYWICEVAGAEVNGENVIPLYSELYSQNCAGFISENEQILKAVRAVNAEASGRGIFAIDRGGDRHILVEGLAKEKARFVIRLRGDRDLTTEDGEVKKAIQIAYTVKCKKRYKLTVDNNGRSEEVVVRVGRKDNLTIKGVKVSLIMIRGFGKKPMMLLTNTDKTSEQVLEIYLTRWKCEETFRFLKHEYHIEDVRVQSYKALRNMIVLVHAVFYFLSIYLGKRLKMGILLAKILVKAKRFFAIPAFKQYAIADGIHRILFNAKWDSIYDKKPDYDPKQRLFAFALEM